ncbi:MAG: PleD family two-component system response regulator [Candidatus Odinarchaeota archaeon]
MAARILIVDDSPDILYNLEITLMCNDYEVISATNGKEALSLLASGNLPDLIISDIMMPEIDGYEFFNEVSKNPVWNHIPFIFLTAKSTAEDIRMGKMLGADDYITKPFKNEDLLATVVGKLSRAEKTKSVMQSIEEKLAVLGTKDYPVIIDEEKKLILLLWIEWDESHGPKLRGMCPISANLPYDIEKVAMQLFHGTAVIYGFEEWSGSQGVLLHIKNIDMDGYLFFDNMEDAGIRGGKKQYLLAVMAPKINYLQSFNIKGILETISENIKNRLEINLEKFWSEIIDIISKTLF